ncbi:hypothetical protein MP228_004448 [Amoeboaphelidium protococcarum]|nr:hypothetical protein MP228_004448 [Amoeboaphelidium protococcarum]
MVNILIGVTGSVATIKLPLLIEQIKQEFQSAGSLSLRVVATHNAIHFIDKNSLPSDVLLYTDLDEWSSWTKRGDPVLHIELRKWADLMVISPLSANSLAKIVNGMCDNLLTCIVRAWDCEKPIIACPAMNTFMYQHPITALHLQQLVQLTNSQNLPVITVIPAISKSLMCGDQGVGAMAEVETIVQTIAQIIKTEKH